MTSQRTVILEADRLVEVGVAPEMGQEMAPGVDLEMEMEMEMEIPLHLQRTTPMLAARASQLTLHL
ncbi:hypothetical protein ACG1BZ_09120 [Microbulbifer sp. CNSA002]|uniref:hypothetical protein n=1 Tax=Microbulbifer sp. CNSA002 TaxID=3373604 RepID=UPI0039B68A90